jgi:hypothetical protein
MTWVVLELFKSVLSALSRGMLSGKSPIDLLVKQNLFVRSPHCCFVTIA